jgi:hypothetical protein
MIFDGADDEADNPRAAKGVMAAVAIVGVCLLIAAVVLAFSWTNARAQQSQPSNCSGTATSTAAAIVFPTSGQTGPAFASQFLTIANPSASATLWVCASKGCTATANAAASIALSPVGSAGQNGISFWKGAFPPPLTVSILSSVASSPFTCLYE